ncbi:zinc finger TRAF-type-containing protein 1 homolog isoform X1 [Tachypleus tridentatus]|uniref:zinc finger TRAF-type-containing protein 1 homolog isoform X1 n=1 Tax=Tachypleus tridentatus TaxID=6853 RepID=UPI003FD08013
MAEELVSVPSVSTVTEACSLSSSHEESIEPAKKKLRLEGLGNNKENRLEQRLGGILCCAVCLDLPRSAIYQCTNGHLMCAGCFTHLLADARLRDETASCPNCRTVISKELCSRNLAVEKAVSELPAECQFCSRELPRSQLEHHEAELCEERLTLCCYSRIGCKWRGPFHELQNHEELCLHPHKTGKEVIEALAIIDEKNFQEKELYSCVFELLSYEKIAFNDLQFKPYRTDEFIHKLYYETSRFTAFGHQWVVKALVNDSQRDPTQSCERSLTYTVVLKSKVPNPLKIHYTILKGPFGDMKINPRLYQYEFSDASAESPYRTISLADSSECNKLLAAKAINFRLIMFHVSK